MTTANHINNQGLQYARVDSNHWPLVPESHVPADINPLNQSVENPTQVARDLNVPTFNGSLFLRGKTWWTKVYVKGKPIRITTGTSDRDAALKILEERRVRVVRRARVRPAVEYHCVYFLRSSASGLIKIGHSRNINKRLANLRTGSHESLELICQIPTGRAVKLEKFLHAYFDSRRVRGEWFELTTVEIYSALRRWFLSRSEVLL